MKNIAEFEEQVGSKTPVDESDQKALSGIAGSPNGNLDADNAEKTKVQDIRGRTFPENDLQDFDGSFMPVPVFECDRFEFYTPYMSDFIKEWARSGLPTAIVDMEKPEFMAGRQIANADFMEPLQYPETFPGILRAFFTTATQSQRY